MNDINIKMLTDIKDTLANLISTSDHITTRMDSIQVQIKVLEMSKIGLKNTPIQNIKSDISKLIDKVEDLEQKIINLNAKILIMVQRKKLSEDVPKTRHCHHRKGDK